jgi:hypothetical protein
MENESNKQTAVEWLFEQLPLIQQEGLRCVIEEAIYMEKKQIIDAINIVSKNNVKYANMIVSSWSQIEGELFMHNTKLAEQYYAKTYGGKDGK